MKKVYYLLFTILLVCNSLSALEIIKINTHTSEDKFFISFYLENEFPQELMDLIHSGVETTLTFKIKIIKNRKLWFDKKLVSKELITKITFYPITKQYKATKTMNGTLISSLETDSNEELEEWLRKFDDISVASLENFSKGVKYTICIEGNIFPKYLMKIIPRNYKISVKKEFIL